jgi:hypothetical protein
MVVARLLFFLSSLSLSSYFYFYDHEIFFFLNRVARVYSHVPTAEQSTRGALSARAHVGTFLVTFPRYFLSFFRFG